MYKIHIHKSLLKPSQLSQIEVDISSVSDLLSYVNNFYPELRTDKILLLNQDKSQFPESWIVRDIIPEDQKICYIVPLIGGKDFGQMVAKLPDILYRSVAALAINFALSAVIQLIMPKPKNNSNSGVSDQDRNNNDAFDGIINTIDSSNSVPLNYGMVRVGGQIISADVNTVNHGKGEQIRVADYV